MLEIEELFSSSYYVLLVEEKIKKTKNVQISDS